MTKLLEIFLQLFIVDVPKNILILKNYVINKVSIN